MHQTKGPASRHELASKFKNLSKSFRAVGSARETGQSTKISSISPIRDATKENRNAKSGQASKRMSIKMALMYKKEVLEGKLQRGEISMGTLEKVLTGSDMAL